MNNELATQLQNLIQKWDELADQACRWDDFERERYYYGISLGLKVAKTDLLWLLKQQSQRKRTETASAGQ